MRRLQEFREWASAHSTLVVATGVPAALFALIAAFLYVGWRAELAEHTNLEDQTNQFRAITQRSQSRGEEVEAEFRRVQEGLPSPDLSEIDVFRTVRELVSDMGLDIAAVNLELKSDVPSKKVGKTNYRVLTFDLAVSGDRDGVWDVIQALDNGETPLRTLILNKVSLTLGESSKANMEFVIYTLPGG